MGGGTIKTHLHAVVHGKVQGVYFRAFVEDVAIALGLTGRVRNLSSGVEVEVEAEGDEDKLRKLEERLRTGTTRSRVDRVDVEWLEPTGRYSDFRVSY
ncbi:MAG: acylphosphatase [Chloroflexota bacterium]